MWPEIVLHEDESDGGEQFSFVQRETRKTKDKVSVKFVAFR